MYFFKLFAWLFVGAKALSVAEPINLSCLSCVQSEELGINDVCDTTICKPDEIRCVAMQMTQIGVGSIYYRGCESPDLKNLADGCTEGCGKDGTQAFYCKKTCDSPDCNDDESMGDVTEV